MDGVCGDAAAGIAGWCVVVGWLSWLGVWRAGACRWEGLVVSGGWAVVGGMTKGCADGGLVTGKRRACLVEWLERGGRSRGSRRALSLPHRATSVRGACKGKR